MSLFTYALYFTLQLDVLKAIWPYLHSTIPDIPLYVLALSSLNVTIPLLYNCAMYFIYTRKLPFFEQWRVSKTLAWPWESNPKEWNTLFWKTLKVSCPACR